MAVTGIVRPHRRGFGFVQLDQPLEGDVESLFLAPPTMADLVDGDRVACEAVEQRNGRWAAEDVVLLERRRRLLAGVIFERGGRLVLRPDPGLTNRDWTIPDLPRSATAGAGVVATIASVDADGRRCGELVAGPFASTSWQWVRLLNSVRHLGVIDRDDPARAAAADDALVADLTVDTVGRPQEGAPEAATGPDPLAAVRADLTAQPCFTVDGPGTRDLDDAIWAADRPDGSTKVTVHIADAASAVRAGSSLDARALTRATTAYLTTGTAPMLPSALSEGALSLRPGRERHAVSVSFSVDPAGAVADVAVGASLVRSAARLTYAAVEARLAGAPPPGDEDAGFEVTPAASVSHAVWEALAAAAGAAERIGAARLARGAMGTDLFVEPEARPAVDGGRVTLHRTVSTPVASHLVERLMVAANEAVAGWLEARKAPALYRVQSSPDPERLTQLAALLATVGLPVDVAAVVDPAAAEALVDAAVDAGLERSVVAGLLAQGLSRAGYHPDPGGHFGLSSASYVHFTSPIRRAADLLVHRAVHGVLLGGGGPTAAELSAIAPWLDHRAGAVARAEKGEARMLWADILDRTIVAGRPYTASALIGAVRRGGLRVRVDRFDLVGMIPREVLAPGNAEAYQQADDEMSATVGAMTYRVGDRLRVAIAEADRATGELTFEPAGR